jgi:hypothetical protein
MTDDLAIYSRCCAELAAAGAQLAAAAAGRPDDDPASDWAPDIVALGREIEIAVAGAGDGSTEGAARVLAAAIRTGVVTRMMRAELVPELAPGDPLVEASSYEIDLDVWGQGVRAALKKKGGPP